jgi:hypothetical protein
MEKQQKDIAAGTKKIRVGKTEIIINPPIKIDKQRAFAETFKKAVDKHAVIVEKKIELVLQAKASRADLPEEVVRQVYIRGIKAPHGTNLTQEQHAMNRVNSFVAFGEAFVTDYDLMERVGLKGSGGAMRPHIKREKSPYNGKIIYHVLDAKGHTKHTTNDEVQAKKHLATKYQAYMEATAPLRNTPGAGMYDEYRKLHRKVPRSIKPVIPPPSKITEMEIKPSKRFEGTKSLVKTYKKDTPGENLKEDADVSKQVAKLKDMIKAVKKDVLSKLKDHQENVKRKEQEEKDMKQELTSDDHNSALSHFAVQYRNAKINRDENKANEYAKHYHDYSKKLTKLYNSKLNKGMK